MNNLMYKVFIDFIYLLTSALHVSGFVFSPSSEAAVQLPQWFKSAGYGVSSKILRQSTHEGGKVVSPTHRPPLTPGNIPGTHFC
jgi:hypothetical protein